MNKVVNAPTPPYYAVIAPAELHADIRGYREMAAKLVELAKKQPGFLGIASGFQRGFALEVSYWASAVVGGTYRMSFANFTTDHTQFFGGEYLELVPDERIRYTDKLDDPKLAGVMQTTVPLRKVSCGAELNVVQEGIPEIIPLEPCYLGWQQSLTHVANLVEPEIPD